MQLQCLEFGGEMVLELLAVHLQIQHGKATRGRRNWGTTAPGGDLLTYKMASQPRRDKELPRRGVSGTGGDADGNSGPLFTP